MPRRMRAKLDPEYVRRMSSDPEERKKKRGGRAPSKNRDVQVLPPPPQYIPVVLKIPFPEDDWRYIFLSELARRPNNITSACAAADVSRNAAYGARKRNKKFAECWEECNQGILDQLEQSVVERALNPWDPASATLAKMVLQAYRPEVFAPGKAIHHDHEIHTRDDQPVHIQVETIDYRNFLGAIAPADRPLIEGEKVKDIEDDDLFDDFREISADER